MLGIINKRIQKKKKKVNVLLNLARASHNNERNTKKIAELGKDFYFCVYNNEKSIEDLLVLLFTSRFANMTEDQIKQSINDKNNKTVYLSAKNKNNILVIFAAVVYKQTNKQKHILLLAINKTFEKLGLSSFLLKQIIKSDENVVLESDKNAINFYKKIGFELTKNKTKDINSVSMLLKPGKFVSKPLSVPSAEIANLVTFLSIDSPERLENKTIVRNASRLINEKSKNKQITKRNASESIKMLATPIDSYQYMPKIGIMSLIKQIDTKTSFNWEKKSINQTR